MRRTPETIGTNAGLALSRYVPWRPDDSKDEKKREEFFRDVEKLSCNQDYQSAFKRWTALMESRKALCAKAVLGGPLAVGLGNESAYETGLTLHRIYGTPVIPGSAIKGACKRAAAGQQGATPVFGSMDSAGGMVFHDAWYVPDSVAGKPLAVDIVTVHHPKYYQSGGKGDVWPTDFDDPVPNAFVSVRAGAVFFFAIEIPDGDGAWRDFADSMLTYTVKEIGLGGKTNAGYGWFSEIEIIRPISLEELAAPYLARVQTLNASNLSMAQSLLASIDSAELRRFVALACKDFVERKLKRWNKDTEGKPWREAIEKALA